jgi:hypothetical protein
VGSTITVSISDDVMQDIDVYDGLPGQSGSEVVMGKDAGTDTFTWTVTGTPSDPTLYAVGLAGTDYDQAVFTASINMAPTIEGSPPDNSPDASPPATQPTTQPVTTPSTVAGKSGHLEALDGTQDDTKANSIIYQFAETHYQDLKSYHKGSGNATDHPNLAVRAILIAYGDLEALKFEQEALDDVFTFYTRNPQNQDIPLDIIGYSRGAMEAVKLVNDLHTFGIPDISKPLPPVNGKKEYQSFKPLVRFVGLVSPVMGLPEIQGAWPDSLPKGVQYFFEALDKDPNNPILLQHPIAIDPSTKTWPTFSPGDGHIKIGHDPIVLNKLIAAAEAAGAPVK